MKIEPWHVGISVSDLTVSVPWYEIVLGFREVRRSRADMLGAQICFLARGGFELELFQYDAPAPLPADRRNPNTDLRTLGTKHLAFRVESIEAILNRMPPQSADIALRTTMAGKQVCFIRDPDGILLELIQADDGQNDKMGKGAEEP